jgi:hypothetical protein
VYVRGPNSKHWPLPYADVQPSIAVWDLLEARKRWRQSGHADPTECAPFANILQQRRVVKEAVSQSQQRRPKERIPSTVEIQATDAEPRKNEAASDLQPYPVEIWDCE